MKYSGIIYNDIAAAPGLSVSFFTQGCDQHCKGCQNPSTWDFDGGLEFSPDILNNIIANLQAQGINRNLCIMGGEPLAEKNLFLTYLVVKTVKEKSPKSPIYLWTGYIYEDLIKQNNYRINQILELVDVLIDGPYIESLRDITLEMRGSSNQRIINLHEIDKD